MKMKKQFIDSIYNLIGLGLPLLFALFSIPIIISHMGDANFGLLTLVWAVVSYFGLFDLGLGRALTQQLAIAIESEPEAVPKIIGTSIIILLTLGSIAGLIMFSITSWSVDLINDVPNKKIAINSMYYMAIAMPAIVLTSGFRGILEANHRFGLINVIRIPMGVMTFCGPLVMVLFFSSRLDYITAVLSIGRILACVIHFYFAARCMPVKVNDFKLDGNIAKSLCSTGGWITISNIISPLMGYADRFLIGLLVSASAVAYYTTPQEMVTKIWIIPGAITSVIFPLFAALSVSDEEKKSNLFVNSIGLLFFITLPLCAFIFCFSHDLLSMWLSDDFALKSNLLLMVFSFGIFINCLAHIPYTYIQSVGKANSTALIHMLEFPFYMVALWFSAKSYGSIGVVITWLVRVMIDTALMYFISFELIRDRRSWPNIIVQIMFVFLFFIIPFISTLMSFRIVAYISVLMVFIRVNLVWIYRFAGKEKCST